ncbi:MAG TPA: MarR family transcriptional regulator [Pseudonocardiaceae bacterium]|nr:MarR family transcriptional regulator [Pseudonocardiaceae bacterium]
MSQASTNHRDDRDDSLADAFRSVSRLLRQASVESLARWDLTPSQFRALRVLMRHATMRPSELSEHLRIAPRSTTEVLDDLAAKGLVERRPDPDDRRATLVTPTEHGTTVAAQIRAAQGSESERVFAKLTPADRAQLARILNELLG